MREQNDFCARKDFAQSCADAASGRKMRAFCDYTRKQNAPAEAQKWRSIHSSVKSTDIDSACRRRHVTRYCGAVRSSAVPQRVPPSPSFLPTSTAILHHRRPEQPERSTRPSAIVSVQSLSPLRAMRFRPSAAAICRCLRHFQFAVCRHAAATPAACRSSFLLFLSRRVSYQRSFSCAHHPNRIRRGVLKTC